MHRFYSLPENFSEHDVTLSESETRHLRDVLRLKTGDTVRVFNGVGREAECSVAEIDRDSARLTITRETEPAAPESPLDLTIAAAVTPPDKFELAIQKSVELGVKRFRPLVTARCEVRIKDGPKRAERWRRIAFEAAKQCGRATLMVVEEPMEFSPFIAAAAAPVVIFSERDGSGFEAIKCNGRLTAVFGPKGGWDDAELSAARNSDAVTVTLGGRILRAETAAIAITAILQHRFGDIS
jgi:16S rRNA (uracil1498-N3)-methyltransferase